MLDYNLRDLQSRLLQNLKEVDRVCRQHNLCYYIEAGTMLGAVRHGGFIPWDDDVDIVMPRPDYDTLLRHSKEWFSAPYVMMSGASHEGYIHPFAKLVDSSTTVVERGVRLGVYVDIFPIDGMTENRCAQRRHLRRYHRLRKMLYFVCRDPYKHGHGVSSWLPLICKKIYSYRSIHDAIIKMQKQYDYSLCTMTIDHDFNARGIMPKSYYGTPTEIEFEGHRFFGVEHPHEYLSQVYGPDYMTPPPPESRHQHSFTSVDLTKGV